ncbi:MAG: tetratricopeptide (TPR) repeat protein, partial [Gammaproteobacteria bacterium]
AIEADPKYSIAYGNVALINMLENNFQRCYDNVTRAIDLDADNAHAHYSAAQCLFMLSKPKAEYMPYYRRYIELEPDNFRTKELYQKYPELKGAAN